MFEYKRIITDDEQKILQHDLLDITDWINKMIEGKINNCAKRASLEYQQKAREMNMRMMPLDFKECALALFRLPTYKDRAERDSK